MLMIPKNIGQAARLFSELTGLEINSAEALIVGASEFIEVKHSEIRDGVITVTNDIFATWCRAAIHGYRTPIITSGGSLKRLILVNTRNGLLGRLA